MYFTLVLFCIARDAVLDAAGAEIMDPREVPEEQDANTLSREMAIRIIQVRHCRTLCLVPRGVSPGSTQQFLSLILAYIYSD